MSTMLAEWVLGMVEKEGLCLVFNKQTGKWECHKFLEGGQTAESHCCEEAVGKASGFKGKVEYSFADLMMKTYSSAHNHENKTQTLLSLEIMASQQKLETLKKEASLWEKVVSAKKSEAADVLKPITAELKSFTPRPEFIKLTSLLFDMPNRKIISESSCLVGVAHILSVSRTPRDADDHTVVTLRQGGGMGWGAIGNLYVKETPEEILAMIEGR